MLCENCTGLCFAKVSEIWHCVLHIVFYVQQRQHVPNRSLLWNKKKGEIRKDTSMNSDLLIREERSINDI